MQALKLPPQILYSLQSLKKLRFAVFTLTKPGDSDVRIAVLPLGKSKKLKISWVRYPCSLSPYYTLSISLETVT